jgi:uncharacterized metal-binding protein
VSLYRLSKSLSRDTISSVALRLSIVLAINGIYTKSGNFRHRSDYKLSIIGPIVTVSRLSFVSVYNTICTKSTVIAYKDCYKQSLYFGLPGV